MDKRMKATLAVALALAFVLAFAVANTDTETDASGENITVVIHESQTYHDGDTFELNADYQLEPGVVLTFEAGSILTIDALTPWSIEGKEGSGFFFKEGSKVLLTALIFSKENVIQQLDSYSLVP